MKLISAIALDWRVALSIGLIAIVAGVVLKSWLGSVATGAVCAIGGAILIWARVLTISKYAGHLQGENRKLLDAKNDAAPRD
jgi:hypothetical protein